MRVKVQAHGARELASQLRDYPAILHRETESILRQQARALCLEYAGATMPGPGFDAAKDQKFKQRVAGDVGRVFASKDRPGSVFAAIQRVNPALAGAYWWGAVKKDNPTAAERILRLANIPRGLSAAALKAARTDPYARVPKTQQPVSLAPAPQVRALVKKQTALVGFAKAGWVAAANSLGGRVRKNIRNDDGTRTTEERFPKSVRDLARKFPGIGGSTYTSSGGRHTLTIFTNVRHARNAMNEPLQRSAEDRAQQRFTKAIGHALRALNKKLRRAA